MRHTNHAYRDGWERIFSPKSPAPLIRNPFPLRRDCTMHYEIPTDFGLADLRRLTKHLTTMCQDWEPEMGWPSVAFSNHGDSGEGR